GETPASARVWERSRNGRACAARGRAPHPGGASVPAQGLVGSELPPLPCGRLQHLADVEAVDAEHLHLLAVLREEDHRGEAKPVGVGVLDGGEGGGQLPADRRRLVHCTVVVLLHPFDSSRATAATCRPARTLLEYAYGATTVVRASDAETPAGARG